MRRGLSLWSLILIAACASEQQPPDGPGGQTVSIQEGERLNNRGVRLLHNGRPRSALVAFHQAVEILPDSAEIHLNMGLAYAQLKQYPEAIAAFEKADVLHLPNPMTCSSPLV